MRKMIKCFMVILCIVALLCACGTSNEEIEYSQTTDHVDTLDSNGMENGVDPNSEDDENASVTQTDINEELDSVVPKILTATNGYRFKNSVDNVRLVFNEIYLISEWNGIKPHNDSFLVMKVTAVSSTPDEDGSFDLPHTIVASNGTKYESINSNFKYNYENSIGETVDIATEINRMYVTKPEGKIRAYDVDYINGGNGTRYIVFDIPQKVALAPESYLIFFGTEREMFKNEVSDLNVYFSDYVVVNK